jgi:hypothetical protein
MGASGWHYFTPYQADIGKAMRELQEDVFQRDDYYKLDYLDDNVDTMIDSLDSLLPQYLRDMMHHDAHVLRGTGSSEPTTIEALRDWNAESGTHSIIDILSVDEEPEIGIAAPLPDTELIRLFGTTRPTRTMIEVPGMIETLMDLRGRGEGTYIIVYHHEQPDEIFFTGFSGD